MIANIFTSTLEGIKAFPISCEVAIERGLPQTHIVGMGDVAVKEAALRVRNALKSFGFEYPQGRVTLNLSPAWLKKKGSHFDLAMAIGILQASDQIKLKSFRRAGFIGELSLDGKINPCAGVLPMVMTLKEEGCSEVVVPLENGEEASLVDGIIVYGATDLGQVVSHAKGILPMEPFKPEQKNHWKIKEEPDFGDIKGQEQAKRAILIAVSGGHGLMMSGSPGTGKTMLAERIPHILPDMTFQEKLELTSIYSVAGLLDQGEPLISRRPFRRPGSSITRAGLLGSGYPPRPGETTLAHHGILYFDELPEVDKGVLDSLREPMDQGKVRLVRHGNSYKFPADFLFVASKNPCKCGYYGDPKRECRCTPGEIASYAGRISGPIKDRIDIRINLFNPEYEELKLDSGMTTEEMRGKVNRARVIQYNRYRDETFSLNGDIKDTVLDKYIVMSEAGEKMLREAYDSMGLNPRSMVKIKKISRTIADLNESSMVESEHVAEALQYREK